MQAPVDTAYPFLYPDPEVPSKKQDESQDLPVDLLRTQDFFPGYSLYKLYSTEAIGKEPQCILVDDLQELAKGIRNVMQDMEEGKGQQKSSAPPKSTKTKIKVPYHSGLWTALEFLVEATPAPITMVNSSITNVHVNMEGGKKERKEKKEKKKSARSKKDEARLNELTELEEELKKNLKEMEDLSVYQMQKKKQKQEEVVRLRAQIKKIEGELSDEEQKERERRKMMLRLIVGGLSLAILPLIGFVSGGELGMLVYAMNLKKAETRCAQLLKDIEANENGRMNPHWGIALDAVSHWKTASSKMIAHSTTSIGAMTAIFGGALVGTFGSWKESSNFMAAGSLACVLGLAGWLFERQRYRRWDEKVVNESGRTALAAAQTLLAIKGPYIPFEGASPVNPETL